MQNEKSDPFPELDAAKASCLTNDNCVGVVDQYGEGNYFVLCKKPLIVENSTRGSIFYQKQFEGKIINYVDDYVFYKEKHFQRNFRDHQ